MNRFTISHAILAAILAAGVLFALHMIDRAAAGIAAVQMGEIR